MDTFIQQLLNGLTLGGIYALIALGYTMVYGIIKLINFAHGEIFMVGAFVGYFSIIFIADVFVGSFLAEQFALDLTTVSSIKQVILDYRFVISIICTIGFCALLGLFVERVAYRPLRDGSPKNVIISACGLAVIIIFAIISRSSFQLDTVFLLLVLSIGLSIATIVFIKYALHNFISVSQSVKNSKFLLALTLYTVFLIIILYIAWYYDISTAVIPTFMFVTLTYWLVVTRDKSAGSENSRINALISALGMSVIISNLVLLIHGTRKISYPVFLQGSFQFDEISVSYLKVFIILFSFVLMAILFYIIHKTKFGLAMRAVSYNLNAARLMGINPDKIIAMTFVLGSSLAGITGVIVGTAYTIADYNMGMLYGLKAFVAAVLGGIGSIPGAVVGGIVLGIAETIGVAYLSPTYKDAIAFGILILILIIKPAGIFGKSVKEKV